MWVFFALLSALSFASAGMVVRYSISKNVRDPGGIIAIHAAGALLVSLLIWVVTGADFIRGPEAFWPVLAGAINWLASYGYFKAYTIDDASNIAILQQMSIPLTLIFGYLLLGDVASGLQLVAAAVIITGVFLASKTRSSFHLRNKKTFGYMLFATACWAALTLIGRHGVQTDSIYSYNFLFAIGYITFALLQTILHEPTKLGFKANLRPFSYRIVWVIVLSEAVFTGAILAQLQALTSASAGLVMSVSACEVFFALLIGWMLTRYKPHLIEEDIERGTLQLKLLGAIITVTGIVLLYN